MLKNKLQELLKEFITLKQKITTKLAAQQQTIADAQTKLTESNQKITELSKENLENEQVLGTLLKEFQELAQQLN